MSAAGIRPETRPDLRLLITKMPGGFLPIPAPELPTNCQQSWTVRAETSDTSPPGGRPFFSFKKKKGHLGNLTLLTLMPSQACHVSSRCWRETCRGKLILINPWVCSGGQRGTEIDFTSCCSGFKDFIKKKEKRKKKKRPSHLKTHLLQNFIQGLGFDNVVQSQACVLFALVCQLQSVRLDDTSLKLPNLWRDLRFHGTEYSLEATHSKTTKTC